MNSGKTIDLMRTAFNYEENGYKIIVMKPSSDVKGGNFLETRIGLKRKADYLINENDSIINIIKNFDKLKCILIDECQFLTRNQVDELYLISKKYDIPVLCYGLRVNFQMNAFNGSMRLLEIAEELEEITTLCHCGEIARYVGRKINDKYVLEGSEVLIDGTDKTVIYVPLCGDCYLKEVKKII